MLSYHIFCIIIIVCYWKTDLFSRHLMMDLDALCNMYVLNLSHSHTCSFLKSVCVLHQA